MGSQAGMLAPVRVRFWGRSAGVVLALVGFSLYVAWLQPGFLSLSNAANVARQGASLALVTLGMALVVLTGGLDISVGSVMGLSAVVMGVLIHHGWPLAAGIAAGLAVGAAVGALNGAMVAYGRFPFILVTLGTMGAARGLALVLTQGRVVWDLPAALHVLADGELLGLPAPLVIVAAASLILYTVVHHTIFGLHLYAVGGAPTVAYLSGVDTARVLFRAYLISGLMAAAGGILLGARMHTAHPNAGMGYEFDAVAAVAVGGLSLAGGEGSIGGALLGTLFIVLLRNGMDVLGVSVYWQLVVIGAIIMLAFARVRRAGPEEGS